MSGSDVRGCLSRSDGLAGTASAGRSRSTPTLHRSIVPAPARTAARDTIASNAPRRADRDVVPGFGEIRPRWRRRFGGIGSSSGRDLHLRTAVDHGRQVSQREADDVVVRHGCAAGLWRRRRRPAPATSRRWAGGKLTGSVVWISVGIGWSILVELAREPAPITATTIASNRAVTTHTLSPVVARHSSFLAG
jgi:hypothetical protein